MSPNDDAMGAGSEASGALLGGLTEGAREALRDVKDEFRDGMTAELRRRKQFRRDLTDKDVYEARGIVARAMSQSSQVGRSTRALGSGLIAIGSVGVGSMHPYLHSAWQIALLVIFALVGVAGVIVASREGRQAEPFGDLGN